MTQQQLPAVEPAPEVEPQPTPEDLVSAVASFYTVSEDLAGKWLRDAFERLPF
jgi:hypothetical protein